MSQQKINSLTGMRFIAIMLIVISHLEFIKASFYQNFLHNANIGVDFFFVLSGFGLMLSDLRRNGYNEYNKISIKNSIEYAKKHVKKIYCLYMTTIVIGIPLFIYQTYTDGKAVSTILTWCALKLSACIFLVQSLSGYQWLSHSFNGVCWFLSSLFCIYLVSPLFINIIKKICLNKKRIFILLILLTLLSSITAFLLHQIEKATFFNDLVYGSPYRRIFYVLFGMVLAILINKYKDTIKIRNINVYETAVTLISALWFLLRTTVLFALPYISLIYIIDMTVVGLIVFFLAYNQGIISKILSHPKFVYLGEMSMYIFLIHYLIRIYIRQFFQSLGFTGIYANITMILVIFAGTYYISKYLYEKQLKKLNTKQT